ncbi:MAG: 3-methyladenine DNA glycosylase 2 [Sulfuritalea sp.]|nr:3-methyladenine DNA glycosylase 2 [Sulfuritalea sp.]
MRRKGVSRVACNIDLPAGFRVGAVLAFHGRDPQAVAERIEGNCLHKGLSWEGRPACLTIDFDSSHAKAELAIDGARSTDEAVLLKKLRHMLGLTQQVENFEQQFRMHPQLGSLIVRQAGLRVPQAASPFEALSWAIIGQQISVGAAISIRRRLIQACGLVHSGGLSCHPDAEQVAKLSEADLRQAGFSQTKAQTLLMLSREVLANRLPLETWASSLPTDEIREKLLALRGIGPWTVNYALLRGFGWLDGSLHGDVAVRRKLQRLLGSTEKISEAFTRDWLIDFSPWRALVAAHLWAMPSGEG